MTSLLVFVMRTAARSQDRLGIGAGAPDIIGGRGSDAADPNPSTAHADAAILIFTRSPRHEGQAKELCCTTGASARAVATTLLDQTLRVTHAVGVDVIVVGDKDIAEVLPAGEHVLVQRGGSFGRRLRNAVADTFSLGYRRVVVVGNDTPALSATLCRQGLDALAAGDSRTVVLGPARDGGYYLIGLNRFDERAFTDIPWKTRYVLARTHRALHGARLVHLSVLTDADDHGSLVRALGEARSSPALASLRRLVTHGTTGLATNLSTRILSTLEPALVPRRRGPPFVEVGC